ncbi:MAG: hypothetical protein JWN46_2063 [Acidimicrobiales bacterium]|nr:hypothetical protein [Acidimicrobiales bacterium]
MAAQRRGSLLVAAVFLVVRVIIWTSGGRFSTLYLGVQPQLLDPAQLRAHPLRAALSTHIQPPLYNFFVGAVLRWSPLSARTSFGLLWGACGLAIVLALHDFLRELGARPAVALIATLVVLLDPYLVALEHSLSYDYPVAAMLVVAVWSVARYGSTGAVRWYLAFAVTVTAIVLSRALFHPLWLALVLALPLLVRPPTANVRRPAAIGALGLALVLAFMVSNQLRFGSFGLSSFLGMNLQASVISPMPPDQVRRLVADGTLSPLSQVRQFSGYQKYEPIAGPCRAHTDHPGQPILADPQKSTGFSNFNAECYLPIYRQLQTDALAAIKADPGRYVRNRGTGIALFFSSPADTRHQGAAMNALTDVYDVALLPVDHVVHMEHWQTTLGGFPFLRLKISLLLAAAFVIVAIRGVGAVRRLVRRRDPTAVAEVFVWLSVLWVAVVGTTVELGENARFRATLDPLLLGLLVVAVAAGVERVNRARRASAT